MPGIPAHQVLAIVSIRRWAQDRIALKSAKVSETAIQRKGWNERPAAVRSKLETDHMVPTLQTLVVIGSFRSDVNIDGN